MKKALVLAAVVIFGLGGAAFAQGALSGSWSTSMCIAPGPPISFSSFSSVLTVDYTISGWTFESVSTFGASGWTGQVFNIDGVLGAFTLSSVVDFIPQLGCFGEWHTTATVNIAGVGLTFGTVLSQNVKDVCLVVVEPWIATPTPGSPVDSLGNPLWYIWEGFGAMVGIEGGVGDFTLAATLYLNSFMADLKSTCATSTTNYPYRLDTLKPADNSYCLCFTSVEFEASFPFCCIELVDVWVGFSQDGFDGIDFCVTDVTFPNLPWMSWDVCLSFYTTCVSQEETQTKGKVLSIVPNLNLGDFACFEVYADLCKVGTCYGGINIYAIGLECEFNGCTFSDISLVSMTDTSLSHWQLIYPYNTTPDLVGPHYWEKFCISCGGDSCCGGAFSFDVCTYFAYWLPTGIGGTGGVPNTTLFDWAMTTIHLAFGISSNFDLTSDLTVKTTGLSSWCLGFNVQF